MRFSKYLSFAKPDAEENSIVQPFTMNQLENFIRRIVREELMSRPTPEYKGCFLEGIKNEDISSKK